MDSLDSGCPTTGGPELRIDVLTIFPGMFAGVLDESIIGRARKAGIVEVNAIDLRDFAEGRHRVTDDVPYGGGQGMVMKPEPFFRAVEYLTGKVRAENGRRRVILMCPQGTLFTQRKAWELSRMDHLIVMCGRYEGVDERVRTLASDEISIGDYVLTGGEIPAMVLIDSVVRLIPGVVGDERSTKEESFADELLEGPHYTRPRSFRGLEVPEILCSGNHEEIRKWRRKEALRRTLLRRPERIHEERLGGEDLRLLAEIKKEEGLEGNRTGSLY